MTDKFLIVRWLLSNTTVLKEIAGIVAGWSDSLSLSQKLEVIYLIAKAVLPVIESFPLFQAQAQAMSVEEQEEVLVTAQAEYGIPIPILISVVAPLVSTLVQIVIARRNRQ
jgi:hypothetical protein